MTIDCDGQHEPQSAPSRKPGKRGAHRRAGGDAVVDDDHRPPGRLDAGSYRIAFRVVSTDGHPVTGQSGFEVIGPGPSTSAGVGAPSGVASATPSAAAPSSATGDGALAPGQVPTGEANHTPGYLVSGALLLAAGMLLLWERRRRRRVDFPPEQRAV